MTTTLLRPTPPARGQRRTFNTPTDFEIRALPDGKVGIRGYAAVYDQVAYGEVVRKGAFDKTVAERDDVRFLVNHCGVPIARTKSDTLSLSLDAKGLIAEAPELDLANPNVAELVSAMQRKDIDQMSFAFEPLRVAEYKDEATDRWVWELLEVRLWDVSVVTYPWYDETSADLALDRALRNLHDGRPLSDTERALVVDRANNGLDGGPTPPPEPAPITEPVPGPVRSVRLDDVDVLYAAI